MSIVHVDWGDGDVDDFTVTLGGDGAWSLVEDHDYRFGFGDHTIHVDGPGAATVDVPVTIATPPAPQVIGTPVVAVNLAGNTLTILKPAGLQAGDWVVSAVRGQVQGTADYTCPAWLRLSATFVANDVQRVIGIYGHPVVDPSVEPASWTLTRINTGRNLAATFIVRGLGTVVGKSPTYAGDGATSGVPLSRHTAAFTITTDTSLQLWTCGAEHTSPNNHVPVSTPAGFAEVAACYTDTNTAVSRTSLWVGKIDGRATPAAEGTLTTAGQSMAAESIALSGRRDLFFADVDAMLAQPGFTWAHRGNSTYFAEESPYAYDHALLRGYAVLEVSMNRTSDGVWVLCHDRDPNRTSGLAAGTLPNVAGMTWAALSAYQNTISADGIDQPYLRWADFLERYKDSGALFVLDPKYAWIDNLTYRDEFWAMCDAIGGPSKVIPKYFIDTTGLASAAASRGYKAWGYAYIATLADANFPTWANAPWAMLGMEVGATQANWTTILGYGKPVVGHIAQSQADFHTAMSKGAAGVQCGASDQILPINALSGW